MIEMKAAEVEVEAMTPEQCWAEIEAVGEIMTTPGQLQSELRNDPALGELFKNNAKEILHIIVDNFDAGVAPGESEEELKLIDRLNSLFLENQVLQNRFTIRVLTRASIAMQQIPLQDMILSLQAVEATDGVTVEGMAELKKLETPDKAAGMAKIDPRVMKIMGCGINAAGGQVEFAKLQHETAQKLPEVFKDEPSVLFTAQMIGAIMTAISSRSATRDMTLVQIRSTIEMVIGAKQALTMANMTAYHMGTQQLVHILTASAEHHINQALNDVTADVPAEAPKKTNVQAEATHFAEKKPGSYSFDGNRTIN